MIQIVRRLRAAKKDDSGISLIELIVAMSLLLVVSIIVIGGYQSVVGSVGTANLINKNSQQAANGMTEMARNIRAATSNPVSGQATNAPAVVSATNESVVIYAYVNLQSSSDQLPVQVRFRVDPTSRTLYEDVWAATLSSTGYWTFPAVSTAPRSTRLLATYVANRTSPNPYLFTYYVGTTALTVPTTGTFSPTQLNSITSIQVTLTTQNTLIDTSRAVTLQNTVGMPNLSQ